MDGLYEELRQQAAAKRDKIIEAARQEYHVALRRIKALYAMMTDDSRPAIGQPIRTREKSLTDTLRGALPKDRTFTIAEACEMMYENPATSKYKATSIRSQFRVLDQAGVIRKVGRRNGHILWVHSDSKIEASPFGALTLAEIAEQMIGEYGPMRLAEIVIRMKERGYRPDESARRTSTVLRQVLTRISGRFVKDQSGRWNVSGEVREQSAYQKSC